MSAAHPMRLKGDFAMDKIIKVIKRSKNEDEYNDNPEECIKILEKLRQEAMVFLYGNKTSFQRTINIIRRK